MRYFQFRAAFICAAAIALLTTAASAANKPNILVIWGDDIGTWNTSFWSRGMMGYQTPNIDRIAKEGVAFTVADTTIASVDPLGIVTGLKDGTTTLTVTSGNLKSEVSVEVTGVNAGAETTAKATTTKKTTK